MRQILCFVTAALALCPRTVTAQDIAVTNVAVVDVEQSTVLGNMTVLIEDGRISAITGATGASFEPRTVVLDGTDRFLIPGLWDMHVHSSTDEITRNILFPLYIANGVTGVRNMAGDCRVPCGPLASSAAVTLERRRDVAAGRLVGPRTVTAGPIIYGKEPGEPSSIEMPATLEEGRALARIHRDRGVDMIKVYDQIPADAFRGLAEEGARLGLPIVGHTPWELGSVEAARLGLRSIEHLFGLVDDCSATVNSQRPAVVAAYAAGDHAAVERNLFESLQNFSRETCASVAAELASYEVWQVPTLAIFVGGTGLGWRDHPGMPYLPREELEFWLGTIAEDAVAIPGGLASWPVMQARVEVLAVDLFRAGVPILAGSDVLTPGVFPGFGLHDELELLVRAGLTPAEALGAATVEPARFFEATDSMGSIEVGKVADLVLLDANPLLDIRHTRGIHAVIARGKPFTREALDELLASAEESR